MGKQCKQWLTLFLGGSKITADGDCSHEIKRCLLLGRKVKTNLDSIFKSRDIILPTKVHLVKATVFPVVMYGCESWTVLPAPLIEEAVFAPLYILASFVKNKVPMGAWVYLLVLYLFH